MMTLWGLVFGLPLLAFGGVALVSPSLLRRSIGWFCQSKVMAAVLTFVAWIWATLEIAGFDVNFFADFAKGSNFFLMKAILEALAFVFDHFWMLTPFLIWLTIIWMPKSLPMRALTGILMLLPSALFRTSHDYRPPAGTVFAPIDLFVITAYVGIVIGMYGMFYPWRIEKGLDRLMAKDLRTKIVGALLAALGLALLVIGCTVRPTVG